MVILKSPPDIVMAALVAAIRPIWSATYKDVGVRDKGHDSAAALRYG
jgi:hypothetical protein